MNGKSQAHHPHSTRWSYLFGAGMILLGIVILSVGVGQAVHTATRGMIPFSIPGARSLVIKKPGGYLAVFPHTGAVQGVESLRVSLAESDAGFLLPLQKVPAGMVVMGRQRGSVLFQCEVPRAGKYFLTASYPEGFSGPEGDALLIHESIQSGRAELIVGIVLFLGLTGVGAFILIRTRRRARAAGK